MLKKQEFQVGARRRLGWAGVAFVAVQLGLAAAIEVWLPEVRDPHFAVREQRLLALRASSPKGPLWVMLGSSRTQLGLQASRFRQRGDARGPAVFNFGMPGCGPMMQLASLERLLDEGVRPDLLLVEIMPPMFSSRGGEPIEERLLDGSRLSCRELVRLLPYYRQPRRVLSKWLAAWLFPCQRRAAALRRLIALDSDSDGVATDAPDRLMDDHGWQHVPASHDFSRRQALTKMAVDQYNGALQEFELAMQPAEALRSLLHRCQRESIPVKLVLMPEGQSFRSLYSPQAETALESFIAELCRGRQTVVIDARRWVADEQFTDGHHLTPAGAKAFTARFQRAAFVEEGEKYELGARALEARARR